jgi:hypothetical protein
MSGIGSRCSPLAAIAAGGTTRHVQHPALVTDEQAQELGECRAVKTARRSVRRRVDGDGRSDARDRHRFHAAQLAAEDTPRRSARRHVTKRAPRAGGHARQQRELASRSPRGSAAGIRKDEVRVRPATDESQQRFDVLRVDARAAARQDVVLGQLHGHGTGQSQALGQELIRELREPVFYGRVEIANGFKEGERYNAMHHGAQT